MDMQMRSVFTGRFHMLPPGRERRRLGYSRVGNVFSSASGVSQCES
jgi:hypothetical protein